VTPRENAEDDPPRGSTASSREGVAVGGTPWTTCSTSDRCRGAALDGFGRCLAHLDKRELEKALTEHPGAIDARGVTLRSDLLEAIIASLPANPDGGLVLVQGQFVEAIFSGPVALDGLTVAEATSFDGAIFRDAVSFRRAIFRNEVSFRKTVFSGMASFARAQFERRALFVGASFSSPVSFEGARFSHGATFAGETSFAALASFAESELGDKARFDDATFDEKASFRHAKFGREASFRKAKFGRKVSFEWSSFGDEASFHKALFAPEARFADATFGDGVSFRNAVFGPTAGFQRASFGDRTWFTGARFAGSTSFARAAFRGAAGFSEAIFLGSSVFEEVTFAGRVRLEKARFKKRASFRLASFERARTLGPFVGEGLVTLDQASFLAPVHMQVTSDRLALVRTSFSSGTEVQVRRAHVALDLASFGSSSLLSGGAPFVDLMESDLPDALRERDERPCVISMRGANVAGLTISGADLERCRFVGANNLDRLRLEDDVVFQVTPKWRTTRRRFIAEEQEWRAGQPSRRSHVWTAPASVFAIERVPRPRVLEPSEIAAIYRELRKGREDASDAPGAADFYYGEMEMRRHDSAAPRSEHLLLWLYWATAGYGLRGMRSIAALFTTIFVFACLFWWFGFSPRPPFTRAVLFSAESTSSLFRVPDTPNFVLTEPGEALQIGLRLLGPLFFALALLSLRGRVRR
jgi:uncharacterized protein YjbI with pentapeptide repeats